ncbi:DUF924 family protein [Pseudomonas sp. CCC3.2]|uniref:DUF924 family protein n=1 Tax=unclassified Pseudomonas TaxID=196821 RepID=UPI002AB470B7|nr:MULTISPECIES: DUF924 family protein [unclassified Pseudomonas]MDY7562945.1 DUF924 family protein [Pseudomonas sp. AB6]MEB0182730.1 DUF924 family protein [Pseudomonas sp. CCC3.2]MEB0212414.1 DUF924 family protein [Pseudomonas sp. AB6]
MVAPWQPLLEWWFGSAESPIEVEKAKGKLWFGKKKSQDSEAHQRFAVQVEQALAGDLSDWAQSPQGWLALVLLLDQLPRMIFRDTPKAFAGDTRAQTVVAEGLALGLDQKLSAIQSTFIYIVLEHSENLAHQDQAIALLAKLLDAQPDADRPVIASNLDYAKKHQRVIARFKRFPHRNEVLGRESTAEEVLFLLGRGSRF